MRENKKMNKYKKAVENKIIEMKKQIEQEYLNDYCKENNIKILEMIEKGNDYDEQVFDIVLDDYKLSNVCLDRYNNLRIGKFSGTMSIEYLSKFRKFFNDVLEHENSYQHRAGEGVLIYYLRMYCENITPEFLEEMCELDDIDGEKNSTFRDWVYGSSCDWQIVKRFGIKQD